MIEDVAHITLDVTGIALHRRGYRSEAGDAPIKENLAAAIIALSGWRFKENFLDPFCGSGTFAIEAALLARNIAPGLNRRFAIEWHPFFEKEIFETAKQELQSKLYPSGAYSIQGSDIDMISLQKAKRNAERAGVSEDIEFIVADFEDTPLIATDQKTTIVTNPPYGERLLPDEVEEIYSKLKNIFEQENVSGGLITSAEEWEKIIDKKKWKNRKLYNGGIPARLWLKK